MGKKIAIFLAFFVLLTPCAFAQEAAEPAASAAVPAEGRSTSGLPIPRFVSLASEQVFVRTGPALRYPIKWVYKKQGLPVEIIQEFDTWRKIRDIDGDTGWVHQSLLSGERAVIVQGEVNLPLHRDAREDSTITAYFEPNVVARADACMKEWCRLENQGFKGWAQRKFLWGIYAQEDFD